jgi:hypothetical protein
MGKWDNESDNAPVMVQPVEEFKGDAEIPTHLDHKTRNGAIVFVIFVAVMLFVGALIGHYVW